MKTNIKPTFMSSFLINRIKKFYNYRLLIKDKIVFNQLERNNNILFKIKLKNYSGLRHQTKLPVRGQRTRTNAKTCKLCKNLKK